MNDFKERLARGCDANADIPAHGMGRHTHIAKATGVTKEGVRRWFAGENKPRSAMIKKLAVILDVDYAWLALGTSIVEAEKLRAVARKQDAGIYALTSFLIVNGYSPAFSEYAEDGSDITTIIDGKIVKFLVISGSIDAKVKGKSDITNVSTKRGVTPVACILKDNADKSAIAYDFLDLSEMPTGATSITFDKKKNCYKSGRNILKPLIIS